MASILNITNIFDKEQKRRNRFSLILTPPIIGEDEFHDDINAPDLRNYNPIKRPYRQPDLLEGIKNDDLELCLYKAHRPHFKVPDKHMAAEWDRTVIIWKPIDVIYYETIGLANKIQGAVKNYIKKGNFAFEGRLCMLDPKGNHVEDALLVGCRFIKSEPCRLSYEDTGPALTKITICYEDCIYQ